MLRSIRHIEDKVEVDLKLLVSKSIFRDLRQARNFFVEYEQGIQKLIEKYAESKIGHLPLEIQTKEEKIVLAALQKLGFLA